jgi:hypothetical protein
MAHAIFTCVMRHHEYLCSLTWRGDVLVWILLAVLVLVAITLAEVWGR